MSDSKYQIDPIELLKLVLEVEEADPIDYGALPFEERNLRQIAILGICKIFDENKDLPVDKQMLALAAIAAKLTLENLVLNLQLNGMEKTS